MYWAPESGAAGDRSAAGVTGRAEGHCRAWSQSAALRPSKLQPVLGAGLSTMTQGCPAQHKTVFQITTVTLYLARKLFREISQVPVLQQEICLDG